MNLKEAQNVTKLLWTGGWDSSFRLLQLVLLLKKKVQPYYIMDTERCSLGYELNAMQNIKSQLFKEHPELQDRILPTVFIEKALIPMDNNILEARERMRKDAPSYGDQYLWMASYAYASGLNDLEIGAEHATGTRPEYLNKKLIKTQEDGISFYKIDERFAGTDIHKLFQYYRFPIRELSKLDMLDMAREHGFYHLMEMTWFCHHPRRRRTPCGFCTPCAQAYQYGMKFRLPWLARFRYHVRWIYNREHFKSLFPTMHKWLQRSKDFGRKVFSKH